MVSLENVTVSFGGTDLFRDVQLMVNQQDRIGLVGRNGAGKSTLFHVIAGDMAPSEGRVNRPHGLRIGFLAQHIARRDDRSVMGETLEAFEELNTIERELARINALLASAEGSSPQDHDRLAMRLADLTDHYHLMGGGREEALAERTLLGLGFEREQFDQPTIQLSGGWRMRIELAKILLRAPDLLLLDEPTNHLDIESIQWLEDYLKGYAGALMLVSHDRRFLDTVTTRTVELSLGKARSFNVPYTQYMALRKELHAQQEAAYRNQQREIEKTEDFINRFRYKPAKSNQVQSRIRMLEKMELVEVEKTDNSKLSIRFPPAPRAGDTVLRVEDVAMGFGSKTVFTDARFSVERGEKVAFVGRNGEGKTTMARVILGELQPTKGTVKIGHNVEIGYFAQDQESVLDPNLTVFETVDRVAVGSIRTKIRDLLGAFLFRGEDVDKPVRVLSGGERNRLAMVKLMLHPYNLLILDEPTNHLDIQAKDILKQALQRYDGTLILVSHDRDFLTGLVGKVYEFGHGRVREHLGGIEDFLNTRKLADLEQLNAKDVADVATDSTKPKSATREEWKQRKQRDNEIQRHRRTIAQLERDIANGEAKQKEMEAQLANPGNMENIEALLQEYNGLKAQVARLMKQWEEQSYELEVLERDV
ncbi:MAG: glycosyl transferase family 2 [Candidatus [Bacteroides] periocalifornicus]|uniref:Probable ATP-binding protein YbiT n=1 Tax=Candidatus [Bacteroides] periocalifornicus TaxID=1702214 RepID=A0A0Q4B6L2_9BACT|nr:MAG: glycosyl transferase family 2 [Candidatus [Bacteroides] periocalifornicus]